MFWGSKGREGLLFPLVDTCFGGSRGNFEGLLLLHEVDTIMFWGNRGWARKAYLFLYQIDACFGESREKEGLLFTL